MKRCVNVIFGLILLLALCACGSYESRIAGTWQGDGSFDMGVEQEHIPPFQGAEQWSFDGDSTAIATVNGKEIRLHYYASDDTLTLNDGGEESWGIQYEMRGSTLRIGNAEFHRIS